MRVTVEHPVLGDDGSAGTSGHGNAGRVVVMLVRALHRRQLSDNVPVTNDKSTLVFIGLGDCLGIQVGTQYTSNKPLINKAIHPKSCQKSF